MSKGKQIAAKWAHQWPTAATDGALCYLAALINEGLDAEGEREYDKGWDAGYREGREVDDD